MSGKNTKVFDPWVEPGAGGPLGAGSLLVVSEDEGREACGRILPSCRLKAVASALSPSPMGNVAGSLVVQTTSKMIEFFSGAESGPRTVLVRR